MTPQLPALHQCGARKQEKCSHCQAEQTEAHSYPYADCESHRRQVNAFPEPVQSPARTDRFFQADSAPGGWSSDPSRFLEDIPQNCVENSTQPGLYGYEIGKRFYSSEIELGDLQEQAAKADIYASPGWKRLQESKRSIKTSETGSKVFQKDEDTILSIDDKVFHQKFGYGVILTLDGGNAEVFFEKAGEKKLKGPLSKFLTLADRINDIE